MKSDKTLPTEKIVGVAHPRLVRRLVFFTMVQHPCEGWMRVGKAFSTKEAARGWVPFVRKAWRGLRTKVSQCTLTWQDGKLTAESVKVLDEKFNMDAPDSPPNVPALAQSGGEKTKPKEENS